jgi:hypothetical protein
VAAFQHINNAVNPEGAYTLVISQDVNVTATQALNRANTKLTITALGGPHTIQRTTTGTLFTVGQTGQTGISLTIGNGITLQGRQDATAPVVNISSSAEFTMLEGSKITGNNSSASSESTGYGAAVAVRGGSTFTMIGGEISGNTATGTHMLTTAGVYVVDEGSTFKMEGGSITDNTGGPDVFISAPNILNLSGNAIIGELILNASSATLRASVNVGAGWSGNVSILHLQRTNASISGVIAFWVDQPVLQPASGYALTATDVGKFPLGNFVGGSVAATRPITPTHEISDSGGNIGTLVEIE